MSKLGKILLGIALLGALVSIVAGYLVIQKYNDTKTNLVTTQTAKEASDKAAAAAKADALTAAQAKADAEAKLSDSTAKVDSLTSKLTDTLKDQDTLKAAVQTANDAAKKAQDDLQKLNDSLGGMTPDQMKDKVDKAEQAVAADQAEQKILQDQLQASQAQIEQLKKDINNSKIGFIPPGVSGKITFVNRTWNFVVLNIGLSNGVVPNGELIIYRGRNFLGKIKVTSAEANTAVADILPNAKDDIQVGDDVLN